MSELWCGEIPQWVVCLFWTVVGLTSWAMIGVFMFWASCKWEDELQIPGGKADMEWAVFCLFMGVPVVVIIVSVVVTALVFAPVWFPCWWMCKGIYESYNK